MSDKKKNKSKKEDNGEEYSASKSEIWACIIFGILCYLLGKYVHEALYWGCFLCIFMTLYLYMEHEGSFSLGRSDNRIDIPNIFGDQFYSPELTRKYVENAFRRAGFTNIECIALKDLKKPTFLAKPGDVASIEINGKELNGTHKQAPRDAHIVITYHSLIK